MTFYFGNEERTISILPSFSMDLGILTWVVFLILKLTNAWDISWFWVWFPLWIIPAIVVGLGVIMIIVVLIINLFNRE